MVLGLVGFEPDVSEVVDHMVTRQGHYCYTFSSFGALEAMIRDEVELPPFDALIYEGRFSPKSVRLSLGLIIRLHNELCRELCVVIESESEDFWSPLEGDVDRWLTALDEWQPKSEVMYLFPQDGNDRA